MSFRLSSGTLDSIAGVYAPPRKYRLGSAGGKARGSKGSSALLGVLLKPAGGPRPGGQVKHAFGSGSGATVSGRAIAAMHRTARRVPEVMVRITGRQNGAGHVLANFSYISRLGHGADQQLDLYTSDGDVLRDGRDMQVLAQDWQEWEKGGDARRKGATSISMILSMPTGTDPERMKEAALAFARDEFANRSWVASLHVDRDHPHVHLTFARRDHDGRRFHPNRDDLFRYRQRFAEKLRERGIEANATPAKARGIDPTHEPIAARKMREKGQVPRIDKSRAERAQQYRDRGIPDPVNAALANRRATVLSAYGRSIAELSASPSLANQVIAKSLERFVETMPALEANSLRAVRLSRDARASSAQAPPPIERDATGAEAVDPVTDVIARARAMNDRLARKGDGQERGRIDVSGQAKDSKTEQEAEADRLRALSERARGVSSDDFRHPLDEALRQVEERNRALRERDQAKDRDGPER